MSLAVVGFGTLFGIAVFPKAKKSPTTSLTTAQVTVAPTLPSGTPVPGIWLSASEIIALPIAGEAGCDSRCTSAWQHLVNIAAMTGIPNVDNQNEEVGQYVLAKAIDSIRNPNATLRNTRRDEVRSLLGQVVGTEYPDSNGGDGRALGIGRKLPPYIIAADIIDLKNFDSTFDTNIFRVWVQHVTTFTTTQAGSIRECHANRPNNWGAHCGAARMAADIYLNDTADLAIAATIFRGWLGNRNAYSGFSYQIGGDQRAEEWMFDPAQAIPVNPVGATKDGHNIDGLLPDDQSRCCETLTPRGFRWPPPYTHYAYGALEGTIVQASMLYRRGYHEVWSWSNQAQKRAVDWLHYDGDGKTKWNCLIPTSPSEKNKCYILDIIDSVYGTNYRPSAASTTLGRNVSFTSWTHQRKYVADFPVDKKDPDGVPVVIGTTTGPADPGSSWPKFEMTVRRADGSPISGTLTVKLKFIESPTENETIKLLDQNNQQPGVTFEGGSCASRTLQMTTTTGAVSFSPQFGGFYNNDDSTVEISVADGTRTEILGYARARSSDSDRIGGTTPVDISNFLSWQFFTPIKNEFNFIDLPGGQINPADLSALQNVAPKSGKPTPNNPFYCQ